MDQDNDELDEIKASDDQTDPCKFYGILEQNVNKFKEMLDICNSRATTESLEYCQGEPKVGNVYLTCMDRLVPRTEDEWVTQYYRVVILKAKRRAHSNYATNTEREGGKGIIYDASAIDFGSIEEIDKSRLYELPKSLKRFQPLCRPFRIVNMKIIPAFIMHARHLLQDKFLSTNFNGDIDQLDLQVNAVLASPAPDDYFTDQTVVDLIKHGVKKVNCDTLKYGEELANKKYAWFYPEPPHCMKAQFDLVNGCYDREKEVHKYRIQDLGDEVYDEKYKNRGKLSRRGNFSYTSTLMQEDHRHRELKEDYSNSSNAGGGQSTNASDIASSTLEYSHTASQQIFRSKEIEDQYIDDDYIYVNWPTNPYMRRIRSLTQISYSKKVAIPRSINSVCLDHLAAGGQLLVSERLEKSAYGDNIKAHNTTLLPNIPGLLSLVTLMFAPKIEQRVKENPNISKSCYVSGLIAGMGYLTQEEQDLDKSQNGKNGKNPNKQGKLESEVQNQVHESFNLANKYNIEYKKTTTDLVKSFFPEDDLEINSNSLQFTEKDLDLANKIRYYMNLLGAGHDGSGNFSRRRRNREDPNSDNLTAREKYPNFDVDQKRRLVGQFDIRILRNYQQNIRDLTFRMLRRPRGKIKEVDDDYVYPYFLGLGFFGLLK